MLRTDADGKAARAVVAGNAGRSGSTSRPTAWPQTGEGAWKAYFTAKEDFARAVTALRHVEAAENKARNHFVEARKNVIAVLAVEDPSFASVAAAAAHPASESQAIRQAAAPAPQADAAVPRPATPPILKVAEVAKLLRLNKNTVYGAIAGGTLKVVRLGAGKRIIRITRQALDECIASNGFSPVRWNSQKAVTESPARRDHHDAFVAALKSPPAALPARAMKVSEVAKILGVTVKTVYRAVAAGKLRLGAPQKGSKMAMITRDSVHLLMHLWKDERKGKLARGRRKKAKAAHARMSAFRAGAAQAAPAKSGKGSGNGHASPVRDRVLAFLKRHPTANMGLDAITKACGTTKWTVWNLAEKGHIAHAGTGLYRHKKAA